MLAKLSNFRIEFRRYSNDLRGRLSTIMPAPGEIEPRVLFRVPRTEIEILDLLEDADKGLYRWETYLVLSAAGLWERAELYQVARPRGPFAPSPRYVGWMIDGAHEHGLDPTYIDGLKALLS